MSGYEYSLFFEHENMGFVRYTGRSQRKFRLDPSPFWKDGREIYYEIENGKAPEKNRLIRVYVKESERNVTSLKNGFLWNDTKYVSRWEYVDPSKITHRKMMDLEEYLDFFKTPFVATTDYLENISYSVAMYTASTPILGSNMKGGIDAAALTNEPRWSMFKNMMGLIPREFNQTKSNNFYSYTKSKRQLNPLFSSEVNVTYKNPDNISVHIPFTLDTELKSADFYRDKFFDQAPLARGYMLDSLLYQPQIPKKLESHIEFKVQEMYEDFRQSEYASYNQELGSAVPKLASAVARLNFREKVEKEDVDTAFDTWGEMYNHSLFIQKMNLKTELLYRLSDDERIFYTDLKKAFGKENLIPMNQLLVSTAVPEWKFEAIVAQLSHAGLIYFPPKAGGFKILDIEK
ncbi:hypothetical protein [Methanohalophilus levihalophilus]|uniref:hypothetical protein n=1 Tax=Methanohalophilus levihalophilus TaxID=1431282 RepID=UPI001AE4DC67|nr:hypothetical protein [Methanohalophilus levihalophilus]